MKKWCKNEMNNTEKSDYEQIRQCTRKFKINEEICSSEIIKE